jgi:2-oxoglutarate dehydrogenase E2 component (dihydrolipoamide succinyltransferase)
MAIEVKVPMLPESVADATIATWHKKAGDPVSRDENLMDLETDKVMLEVPSPVDGILKEIIKKSGDVVQASQVVAIIEAGAAKPAAAAATKTAEPEKKAATPAPTESTKKAATTTAQATTIPAAASATGIPPSVRRRAAADGLELSAITSNATQTSGRTEKRVPMTRIRTRIAERLLEVTQNTAMLTTFNEINLQHVIDIRNRYKDKFEKVHNARLGFMSFFVKAAVEALKRFPAVNASIDGNDIVYHGYFDIGVAVSTERGLVVPVLRNADQMSMAEIEAQIAEYANKARAGKLSMEEMQGGTFTITNGGVFGSLLSTPILNSPQSAILGMHKIDQRPVVENNQIVIRPMMYVAMSYDHRIIDGKDSVGFLVTIKEFLEDPSRLLLQV